MNCSEGIDTRGKGPLLHLETPSGVWPPPRNGAVLDDDATALETPLLAPSALPLHLAATSDDCLLDEFNTEVSRSRHTCSSFYHTGRDGGGTSEPRCCTNSYTAIAHSRTEMFHTCNLQQAPFLGHGHLRRNCYMSRRDSEPCARHIQRHS